MARRRWLSEWQLHLLWGRPQSLAVMLFASRAIAKYDQANDISPCNYENYLQHTLHTLDVSGTRMSHLRKIVSGHVAEREKRSR
jgi:hypothetical protein